MARTLLSTLSLTLSLSLLHMQLYTATAHPLSPHAPNAHGPDTNRNPLPLPLPLSLTLTPRQQPQKQQGELNPVLPLRGLGYILVADANNTDWSKLNLDLSHSHSLSDSNSNPDPESSIIIGCLNAQGRLIATSTSNGDNRNKCAVFQAPTPPALLEPVSVLGLCTFRDISAEVNVESAYGREDHAWSCGSESESEEGLKGVHVGGGNVTLVCFSFPLFFSLVFFRSFFIKKREKGGCKLTYD